MKTIIFEGETGSPDCPEWHTWRKLGIGGSDAPVVAADAGIVQKAKWMDSVQTLWEMKTGKRGPKPANPAMMRGRKYEEAARIAYEKSTRNLVNSAFGENDKWPYVRASFDGLSFDGNLIVEIKVPGDRTMQMVRDGNIPEYYLPQLAHQAIVAWGEPGPSWQGNVCHFVAYVPETGELVRRDASILRLADIAHGLLEAESRFWEFVRLDVLPCGDVWQGPPPSGCRHMRRWKWPRPPKSVPSSAWSSCSVNLRSAMARVCWCTARPVWVRWTTSRYFGNTASLPSGWMDFARIPRSPSPSNPLGGPDHVSCP